MVMTALTAQGIHLSPDLSGPRIPEHLFLSALRSDRSMKDLLRKVRCYRSPLIGLITNVFHLLHQLRYSRLRVPMPPSHLRPQLCTSRTSIPHTNQMLTDGNDTLSMLGRCRDTKTIIYLVMEVRDVDSRSLWSCTKSKSKVVDILE